MSDPDALPVAHGATDLPNVRLASYNLELRDKGGFLGDKASETAFRQLLDDWRDRLSQAGRDPLGQTPTDHLKREDLDAKLGGGDPEAARVLEDAIDAFSQGFADVLSRFLAAEGWVGVERIVCGGGLQSSRIGRRVVERTGAILAEAGVAVTLSTLRHDPDDGGMIGWVHAAPRSSLSRGDAILAVDVGGTNLRCGLVLLNGREAPDFAAASIHHRSKWCHADETPSRDETVAALIDMLNEAAGKARNEGIVLSPFVGLSCPGVILPDGRIDRGVQNLPGDWTAREFRLADRVAAGLDPVEGQSPLVLVHNDAVMQGLSQYPFMRDAARWAAVTIGTGLGNCSFHNRDRS